MTAKIFGPLDCHCTTKHVPLPRQLKQVEGTDYWLCPTSYANLMLLIETFESFGGNPPGSLTKHYGKHVRDIAKEVYDGR